MREAVSIVNSKEMSVSGAATLHGIPRSTLNDHCHGRELPGARSVRPTILFQHKRAGPCAVSPVVSQNWLRSDKIWSNFNCGANAISSGWSCKADCDDWMVEQVLQTPPKDLRTPATLSLSWASASIKECIDNYFDLEKVLDDYDLRDQPSLIFNMDESGFPLDPQSLKTSSARGKISGVNLHRLKISDHCSSMSQRIRTNYSSFNYLESQDHVRTWQLEKFQVPNNIWFLW